MNFLDVRTVVFSQLVTNVIGALVIALLWWQNRHRFAGTAWWAVDFAFQATTSLLIILRGSIPDWLSLVVANTLAIAGALAGLIGLERFLGKRGAQLHNLLLLVIFAAVHTYFSFVQPDLAARNLNLALGLLIVCGQCVWLLWRRVQPDQRRMTTGVGATFGLFCAVSFVRIVVTLANPRPNNDLFKSGLFDVLILVAYQVLLLVLAYSLSLMVNRRLLTDVQIQEEKFATAFRSSPYAITLTRLVDGRILEVNDGFVGLTGYSHAEVIGNTTVDLRLWAREADRALVVSALAQRQRIYGVEFQFRKKSGELMTGLFSAEVIEINRQPWVLSSISDITDRKQAEDALRRQNAYLAALQETNLDLVSQLDLDTLLEKIVQRAGQLMGTSAGYLELVDPQTGQLMPRVAMGALAESLWLPVQPGEGIAGTVWLTGQPLIVADYDTWPGRVASFSHNAIRAGAGVPLVLGTRTVGVLGLAYDAASPQTFDADALDLLAAFARLATLAIENARLFAEAQQELVERKHAEEKLQLFAAELERSNKELEQFAYIASHDLQEPLRTVIGYLQLIARRYEGQLDRDMDEFIGFALDGVRRMQRLISNLLAYSRVGTRGAAFEPVDCNQLFAQAAHDLQMAISESAAKITCDPLPVVMGDSGQLGELFQNLIGNAIKYRGDQAPIVHITARQTFEVSQTPKVLETTVWEFSICDNGIGIDPQYHDRIFGLFQRLHGAGEYSGSGIGLAICKKIVERHGGRIWVASQVGQGSTFYFTIPAA